MKRIMISAAAALALAVAACGGSDFAQDFNATQQPLAQKLEDVAHGPAPRDMDEYAARMKVLADVFDQVGVRMRELRPPADARDEFDAYVRGVTDSARAVRRLEAVARKGKPEPVAAALPKVQAELARVERLERALVAAINE
jgi:hypothetical protein